MTPSDSPPPSNEIQLDRWREDVERLKGKERFSGDELSFHLYDQRQMTATTATMVRRVAVEAPRRTERVMEAGIAWVYLNALLDDLRAADAIVGSGYVNPALGVIAGLLDGVAMLEYYALGPSRTEKFATHDDAEWPGTRTHPQLRSLAVRVSPHVNAHAERLAGALKDWYALASVAKHKNPMLLREKLARRGRELVVWSGPAHGGEHSERAAAALSMGIIAVLLAAVAVCKEYGYAGESVDELVALTAQTIESQQLSTTSAPHATPAQG